MDTGIITKTNLKAVIEDLMQRGEVVAPVRKDDYVLFASLPSAEAACLDYANSKLSPKGCFFPQAEVLFYYQKEGHKIFEPPNEVKPGYLLGIRPCDARAIALLDPIFDEPRYQDVYYLERRKSKVMIGLACTRPQSTCFCSSTGGSPSDTTGLDMLWQDLGDRYLVRPITDRGRELLAKLPHVEEAAAEDLAKASEQEQAVLAKLPPIFSAEEAFSRLSAAFDDPLWQRIYERCLGCATCAFVCPTCHCFDIQDENRCGQGRRVRLWDSCQFSLFTLHTSGHNPRPCGKERLRQRVMHKFNYFKVNNGQIACVGCGRCIRECPVNMDIRQIVSAYCLR
ncbi:MAG: 4Fe-4S dicluster domain-containing protein [bacterium]|nr:4Fe-4S dicluster domain-containing protein [bacterium]